MSNIRLCSEPVLALLDNIHEFIWFFCLTTSWENAELVARRNHHSTLKFLERFGQQHLDEQVFGNRKYKRKLGCEKFPACNN